MTIHEFKSKATPNKYNTTTIVLMACKECFQGISKFSDRLKYRF